MKIKVNYKTQKDSKNNVEAFVMPVNVLYMTILFIFYEYSYIVSFKWQ